MTEGIHITRAHLHDLLTDAHVALVEHRTEQAGAIIGALRKITAPETHPARAPLPFHAPTLAAEETQPAHQAHRPFGGAPVTVWTDDRVAMLRERFPTCADDEALLADLRALPGAPIKNTHAVGARAYLLGIKRDPAIVRALRAKGGAITQAARRDSGDPLRGKWSPDRLAMLRAELPTCTDRPALLARINALPGKPITSVDAMRTTAAKLGIRTTPETERALRSLAGQRGGVWTRPARQAVTPTEAEPEPAMHSAPLPPPAPCFEPPLVPEPAAPSPPPAPEQPQGPPPVPLARPIAPGDEKADAFAAFDAGQTVRDVVADFDVSLTTAIGWHQEWKRATQEKAA